MAVRGGWQTPVTLGSRSSEDRLKAGQVIPAQPGSIPTRHPTDNAWTPAGTEPFRILNGPDLGALNGCELLAHADRLFRVGTRSNRIGLRLEGDRLELSSPGDRLSAPVAPGTIQAAGGQLIVLGVACGTMGGYPHVAQVISADLDRLGQLGPGDSIRFKAVTLEEARLADREARRDQPRSPSAFPRSLARHELLHAVKLAS